MPTCRAIFTPALGAEASEQHVLLVLTGDAKQFKSGPVFSFIIYQLTRSYPRGRAT